MTEKEDPYHLSGKPLPTTRIAPTNYTETAPGQMLIAFEFVRKTLKIRLVVGQCALAAAIAESLIEPSWWKLTERL